MAEMIISTIDQPLQTTQHMQVMVHIQAEVLTASVACQRARSWLAMNAGHLLQVENPELLLGDLLCWRFDVILATPRRIQPGTAQRQRIGQLKINARTGELINSEAIVTELMAYADSLTSRAA